MTPKSKYKTATATQADEVRRKKRLATTQALFIILLIVCSPLSYVWGFANGVDSGEGDSRPPRCPTDTHSVCSTEFIHPDNHSAGQLSVEFSEGVTFGDSGSFAIEADPELYWVTHYGPPTFGPYDEPASGKTLGWWLLKAEELAVIWDVQIDGICAVHEYTPWYFWYEGMTAEQIGKAYPPLLKVEGRGNYLVVDHKGENDSVGVDIYEPDQDGPMYNYKGEVTEIVGWWCE